MYDNIPIHTTVVVFCDTWHMTIIRSIPIQSCQKNNEERNHFRAPSTISYSTGTSTCYHRQHRYCIVKLSNRFSYLQILIQSLRSRWPITIPLSCMHLSVTQSLNNLISSVVVFIRLYCRHHEKQNDT